MRSIEALCRDLDYRFSDISLLELALTHRSAAGNNNERLEFLGDAILNFLIAEEVYRRFASATEGEMSRLRASLVRGETLAAMARRLELGEYLRLGAGELKSGGFRRDSILADALEAVFGAVYLDGGFEAARGLIGELFLERVESLSPVKVVKDPKTRLQEYLQARGAALPEYRLVSVGGDAHEQRFVVACRIETQEQDTCGEGSSRRKAEQAAAQNMLDSLGA